MIENLTVEKLKQYGFSDECIKNRNTWYDNKSTLTTENNCYVANNIENIIYSGIDGYRSYYFKINDVKFPQSCLSLISEYYTLMLDDYLKKEKQREGASFVENAQIEAFKESEISWCENRINYKKDFSKSRYSDEKVKHYVTYLRWLENMETESTNVENEISKRRRIATKLNGYCDENKNIKTQPVFHYIKDVLKEYKLSPFEAIDILKDTEGAFNPDFNRIVTVKIISYLKNLHELKKELTEPQQSIKEPESIESKEPENPYKKIFINGFSFELFEKLRDEIIINPNHNYADYSFIMCQMISDEFLHETNHAKLIKFLDTNYQTTIGVKYIQFKFADTDKKKRAYSKLKKQFKPKINSIL